MTPSTADRVAPLLQQRIQAVFRRLPKALAGGEEDLHQMRVAGRRLRVALPLLVLKPEGHRGRRSLKLLRGLTRTGGISRDLDVSVALFESELAKNAPSAEDRILRRRLRAARTRGHARMAEALLDLEIARLRRDLRVLARRGDGVFAVLRRIRELRDEKGAQTLALIATLGDRFDAVELHRLRRQVRRLRYAAELSGAVKGQVAAAAADFRTVQDELGALHDIYVLSEWFRRQAESCRMRGDRAVGQAATAWHERFLEASRAHHQAFLALLPADVVARALAAMGQSRPAA